MINIDWKPNKSSKLPLYRQIVNYIKEKISRGEWIVGTKLPSQREMADIFNVNRSTVVEAIDELKSYGLVYGKSKGGTIIVNNTWSVLASGKTPNWEKYIKSGIYEPNLSTIQMINKLEYEDNIIRLSTGELSPELFPKDAMKTVLSKVADDINSLGYERTKGSLELRRTISNYVKKIGINASPSSILIVSGSLQALQLISMSILKPGDDVLIEKPSYIKSINVFESAGMNLKGISMDMHGIDIRDILKNIDKETPILYTIPTFQNPTGIVMSENRRNELIKICTKERLPIIEDDAYRELWFDEKPPQTLKSKDRNGIVLYIGTISKCLSAGMRVGWVIGPEAVIDRLGDVKMQTDYGASSLSQYAADEWISSGLYEKYIENLRHELKSRRDFTINLLHEYFYDIAEWNVPKGGFYIWLKLKVKIDVNKLFNLSWKQGILINPGYIYDFHKNNNIRISYSYASNNEMYIGIKRLSEIIRKLVVS